MGTDEQDRNDDSPGLWLPVFTSSGLSLDARQVLTQVLE